MQHSSAGAAQSRLQQQLAHLASADAPAVPRQLTAEDFDECMDFLDLVFSGNGGHTVFTDLLPGLYQPQLMHWQWAIRVGKQLMAVVGVFPRTLKVLDATLSVGGIGGVATHHRLSRGSGHMRALMNHCVDEMRSSGCDLAILGGQRQRYAYCEHPRPTPLTSLFLQQPALHLPHENI